MTRDGRGVAHQAGLPSACAAPARFGEDEDATVLSAYLDRYLPQVENRYDQEDALGALLLIDEKLATDESQSPHASP
ncbi:DUF6000 family protein [Herbidospora solisilvae]|uniref:DUF6000 family protein n=1 Tax=Herbidospora solisilvae TaxID=2696284 RepID=UPI0038B23AC1